jgi:outer membrane biosynthesis protein TonB
MAGGFIPIFIRNINRPLMRRITLTSTAALVAAIFTSAQLYSQSKSTLEDQGYDYLNAMDFVRAYDVFDKLHAKYPNELDYQFKLGICALNYAEKKERAIEIFRDIRDKKKTAEAEMYLGKAYHRNYRFDDALLLLQPLLEQLNNSKKKEDKELIPEVQLTIKHCVNGNFLMQNKTDAVIVNIGPPINTRELEAVPVITADESMLIYTYVGKNSLGGKLNAEMKNDPNGRYLSDIYITLRDSLGTGWDKAKPVIALNTKGNDAAIAISPDGSQLFSFLSTNENEGDIQVSSFDGKNFSPPTPLNPNVNTPEYWEGSCSISADGKFLYISSERPGGLGGRDIWACELIDGDWGPAVNLGDKVNTEFDEDAPFIHPDGVTLFFSSKGHTSIGGYDIMFSVKGEEGWSPPTSMGVPVNTTEDDSYYVINSRGDKGYFSSTRTGSGGYGSHDIYMVTPGILGAKPIVAMLKGTVLGNDKPIEAKIEVLKAKTGENAGNYTSAKENGKYLLTFSPGQVYKIKVSAEGFNTIEEELDLSHLDRFMEQTKDYSLYSQPLVAKENEPVKTKEAEPEPQTEVAKTEEPVKTTTEEPTQPEKEPVKEPVKEEPVKQAVVKTTEPVKQKTEEVKSTVLAKAEEPKSEVVAATTKKMKETSAEKAPVLPKQSAIAAKLESFPCTSSLPELSNLKGKSLNDPNVYTQLIDIAGNYCSDNVVFSVQVGAYRHPENFKSSKIEEYGAIESASFPDGITRFTQKKYNTIRDAEKHRQVVIGKGIKDAWIIAFVGDKRYTLEDFIMVDFLGKAVN